LFIKGEFETSVGSFRQGEKNIGMRSEKKTAHTNEQKLAIKDCNPGDGLQPGRNHAKTDNGNQKILRMSLRGLRCLLVAESQDTPTAENEEHGHPRNILEPC